MIWSVIKKIMYSGGARVAFGGIEHEIYEYEIL